jgi:hypothetical protein
MTEAVSKSPLLRRSSTARPNMVNRGPNCGKRQVLIHSIEMMSRMSRLDRSGVLRAWHVRTWCETASTTEYTELTDKR